MVALEKREDQRNKQGVFGVICIMVYNFIDRNGYIFKYYMLILSTTGSITQKEIHEFQ